MSTEKNILVDIWLISQLTDRLVADMMGDSKLSVDEFALYGLVADLGPLTSSDLVRATGMSPTTVSGLVRRCEERGELERSPNPEDARSMLLTLTARGAEVYLEVVPALVEGINQLNDDLENRHEEVRLALQDLDGALRHILGVASRPYVVERSQHEPQGLGYSGSELSPRQRREVLMFIDWVRTRDDPLHP